MFSVVSCAPESMRKQEEETRGEDGLDQGSEEDIQEKFIPISQLAEETPTEIVDAVGEKVSVDAKVTVPEVEEMEKMGATLLDMTQLGLEESFFDDVPETETPEGQMPIVYEDESSEVIVHEGGLLYRNYDEFYFELIRDSTKTSNEIYSELPTLGDLFEDKELEFADKLEVEREVEQFLKEIFFMDFHCMESYGIDSLELKKTQESIIEEHRTTWLHRGEKTADEYTEEYVGDYSIKDKYTEEDELYVMFFAGSVEDVPVTTYGYEVEIGGTERWCNGTIVEVWYSKEGIIYLDGAAIYEMRNTEEVDEVISVWHALDILYESENQIITEGSTEITEINLEYWAQAFSTNYEEVYLVPMWSFMVQREATKEGQTYEVDRIILVDAITGEVIR